MTPEEKELQDKFMQLIGIPQQMIDDINSMELPSDDDLKKFAGEL